MSLDHGVSIRVTGLVQGVGFRPTVWRIANELALSGSVRNDGDAVLIEAWGNDPQRLATALRESPPPLARIDAISTTPLATPPAERGAARPRLFEIVDSTQGHSRSGVVPDAATCAACIEDSRSPLSRRFRYPFTNCTHCGPRFSIVRAIPYDRENTSMASFELCAQCSLEYGDPSDRRFHAQPNACHVCGPQIDLVRSDGRPFFLDAFTQLDACDAFATLIHQGHIVAVKGIGGYHLACDASSEQAVSRLRSLKGRPAKPLALMARDVEIIECYALLSDDVRKVLCSPAAPIVLLPTKDASEVVAQSVAPESSELGFMLPSTPLHALMLRRVLKPIVMTSGNHSGAPPATDDDDAHDRLAHVADYFVKNNRPIANRVDDSVVRVVAGKPRIFRRARGYAPSPFSVPSGFGKELSILAMGAELKNTFCVWKDGVAVVSQHIGDLGEATTCADYDKNLDLYAKLYDHQPTIVAVDLHPGYFSRNRGLELASARNLELAEVQHHHAHLAACMLEHHIPLSTKPVLGVALDGLGLGADGALWGGEFLAATYNQFVRLGTFKPVAMLGGDKAMREPWRNTFAHINAGLGWPRFQMNFADIDLARFFAEKPLETLRSMLGHTDLAPEASSVGRLFDAVAAAAGICRESISFEGQAAMALEAACDAETLASSAIDSAYPFSLPRLGQLPYVEPIAMWQALLGDLVIDTPASVIAARFHKGLANAIVSMILKLSDSDGLLEKTVVLAGGVWQNKILAELVDGELTSRGFRVLLPQIFPANDGGIALGQAAIAAARQLAKQHLAKQDLASQHDGASVCA